MTKYWGQQGKVGAHVKKPKDFTEQIYQAYHKDVVKFTARTALMAKRVLENQFTRKSPKKERRKLYYFASAPGVGNTTITRALMSMGDYAKLVKRYATKKTKRGKPSVIFTGKVLSTRRSGNRAVTKRGTKPRNINWLDNLKNEQDEWRKIGAPAGHAPYTWRNPNKKNRFPDYYLRKMIFTQKISDTQIVVYISPYFKGDRVIEILERGGTKHKRIKRLLGFRRNIYRINSGRVNNKRGGWSITNGRRYGSKRIEFVPVFEEKQSNVLVGARPFLGGAESELRNRFAQLWKG